MSNRFSFIVTFDNDYQSRFYINTEWATHIYASDIIERSCVKALQVIDRLTGELMVDYISTPRGC